MLPYGSLNSAMPTGSVRRPSELMMIFRPEKVVPAAEEEQQCDGGEHRLDQRGDDGEHDARLSRPIYPRRLDQVVRDRGDGLPDQEDPDGACEVWRQDASVGGGLNREAGLACSPRAGERDEAGVAKQPFDLCDLPRPTDEAGQLDRQFMTASIRRREG